MGQLGLSQGNRVALFPLGRLQPLVQLFLKIAIAHLLEDVGLPSLVDFECFATMRADDFMHVRAYHVYWILPGCSYIQAQFTFARTDTHF